MARPTKPRNVSFDPNATYFKPRAIPLSELEEVVLKPDEIEAIGLCDLKDLNQKNAAKKMGVSQSTLGRILVLARKKIAKALISGKAIRLETKKKN